MADNYVAKDASSTNVTFDSKDIGSGVQRPRVEIKSAPAGVITDIGDSTSSAAVITDVPGTVLGFLRGIVKLILAVFPSAKGQQAVANSLSVTLATGHDPIQLTAGSAVIGTVMIGDPSFTQVITPTSSADITTIADITPAPASGQKTVVESVTISAAAAMIVTLKEETTLTIIKVFNLTAGNLNAEWNPNYGAKLANINKKLRAISNTAGQVDITVISHSAA